MPADTDEGLKTSSFPKFLYTANKARGVSGKDTIKNTPAPGRQDIKEIAPVFFGERFSLEWLLPVLWKPREDQVLRPWYQCHPGHPCKLSCIHGHR